MIPAIIATAPWWAQDTIYSGPQPGEKLLAFKVLKVVGVPAPQELTLTPGEQPTVLVFWHGVERSALPLVRVVDQYGAEHKSALTLHHIVLYNDRLEGEKRVPLVQQSLKLASPLTLSPDGMEGPGSYGLNKKCLLTILVGKGGKTTASFALVQPGIADAPKVLKAIAEAIGDTNPPTPAELEAKWMTTRGGVGGRGREMTPERPAFDLNTEKGLREAVAALQAEVAALRKELSELKGQRGAPSPEAPRRQPAPPAGPLPGAAPTDPQLLGLLRAFIQPANADTRVDEVLKEVSAYIKGKPELEKQAYDGWIRVLHLKYGTPYAQAAGQKFVDKLKR
ncbi:hypothetical protein [Armatimonas sp.]|uniref:hypothetical protein n=1 Tax=Armatimonas sp. TaxID=1872638 RepID=UPI00286C172D|nr:hypothetical protein [Armatimonas sp.]